MLPLHILRTQSEHPDFRMQASELEAELKIRDGSNHAYYATLNEIGFLPQCIVLFSENKPVACGALRAFDENMAEMKRVYVKPELRGNGIASYLLKQLEQWAIELGYKNIILETGLNQPEAIALYTKCGYTEVEKFGKYCNSPNSVCFTKSLS